MSAVNSHAPETIGNYVIENALAHGSMGTVYIAHHALTYARVALKVIRSETNVDKQAEERFLREVRAAAQIGHDGIVKVQDAGKTPEGHLYLAMELLAGETLEDRMNHGTGERLTIMEWLGAMLEPLAAAHSHSIVHRDLKPANVFIARSSDGTEHIKLLDFGLARDTREKSGTQTGIALGTPYYMSPEQAARPKDVAPASDVWSVGVMMYEILTGHMPFEGETLHAVVIQAATTPHIPCVDRAPGLDRELAALVDACLSKDPALRPRDAGELSERLYPLLGDETVRAELANAVQRASSLASDGEEREPKRMPFADTAIALAHDSRIQDVHPRANSGGLGIWISALTVLALAIAGFFWALERNADKNASANGPAPTGAADSPPALENREREHSRSNAEPTATHPSAAQDVPAGSRRERARARHGATSANGVALPPAPSAASELVPSDEPDLEAQGAPTAAPSGEAPAAKSEPAPDQASSAAAPEPAPPTAPPSAAAPPAPPSPAPEPSPAPQPVPEASETP